MVKLTFPETVPGKGRGAMTSYRVNTGKGDNEGFQAEKQSSKYGDRVGCSVAAAFIFPLIYSSVLCGSAGYHESSAVRAG